MLLLHFGSCLELSLRGSDQGKIGFVDREIGEHVAARSGGNFEVGMETGSGSSEDIFPVFFTTPYPVTPARRRVSESGRISSCVSGSARLAGVARYTLAGRATSASARGSQPARRAFRDELMEWCCARFADVAENAARRCQVLIRQGFLLGRSTRREGGLTVAQRGRCAGYNRQQL